MQKRCRYGKRNGSSEFGQGSDLHDRDYGSFVMGQKHERFVLVFTGVARNIIKRHKYPQTELIDIAQKCAEDKELEIDTSQDLSKPRIILRSKENVRILLDRTARERSIWLHSITRDVERSFARIQNEFGNCVSYRKILSGLEKAKSVGREERLYYRPREGYKSRKDVEAIVSITAESAEIAYAAEMAMIHAENDGAAAVKALLSSILESGLEYRRVIDAVHAMTDVVERLSILVRGSGERWIRSCVAYLWQHHLRPTRLAEEVDDLDACLDVVARIRNERDEQKLETMKIIFTTSAVSPCYFLKHSTD